VLDILAGWLTEVAGDRLLKGTAEQKLVTRALTTAIGAAVRQEDESSRDRLTLALEQCFARPVDGVRLDPSTPDIDQALREAVAAQVATLADLRETDPPRRPLLDALPVDLPRLQARLQQTVVTALRQEVAAADPQALVFSGYFNEILRHLRESSDPAGAAPPPAPPPAPLGQPISGLDPFALQVHPAIHPGDPDLPALPVYVPREHDEVLAGLVADVSAGSAADDGGGPAVSRFVVLVGGSSAGKTRALWEAVQHLPPDWRLWNPRLPQALVDGVAGLLDEGRPAPRTVVWLNELQNYLAPPGTDLGQAAAAAVLDLLESTANAPVLIVGTLWPEHWQSLTAAPAAADADRHSQARTLLSGRDVRVPDDFIGHEDAVLRAAARDSRWHEAIDQAQDRPTLYLAGGYDLLRRYENATPAQAAVLDAAADARRLGHPPDLPVAFLRTAAEGYLRTADWQRLDEDEQAAWFDVAVRRLKQARRGLPGPLAATRPTPAADATPRLELADYLEQTLRYRRTLTVPPASFWDAAVAHVADADTLTALGDAARDRGRLRHAAALYERAARCGDSRALYALAMMLDRAGDQAGAESAALRAADTDDYYAVHHLWQRRESDRDLRGAARAMRRAADAGDTGALLELARVLRTLGERDAAEQALVRAATSDDGLVRSLAARDLARIREETGDEQGADEAARTADQADQASWSAMAPRIGRAGDPDLPGGRWQPRESALQELARTRAGKGDRTGAERALLSAADLGNTHALRDLVKLRQEQGDPAGAEDAARRAAAAGDPDAWADLARQRRWDGDTDGAERAFRQAAEAGHHGAWEDLAALREGSGDPAGAEDALRRDDGILALMDLVRVRERAGDRPSADEAADRAAAQGYLLPLVDLGRSRSEAGDHDGAEDALLRAAAAGDRAGELPGPRVRENADEALVVLATQREARGDHEGADEAADRAAGAGSLRALMRLVELRTAAGGLARAESSLLRAAAAYEVLTRDGSQGLLGYERRDRLREDATSALRSLATLREGRGDVGGACEALERAADAGGSWILRDVVRLREAAGDRDGADRAADRAADTGSFHSLEDLALLREDAGDPPGALEVARRGAAKGDTRVLLALARIRRKAGDLAGATRSLEAALEAGDVTALRELAALRAEAGDPAGAEEAYVLAGSTWELISLALDRERGGDRSGAERALELAAGLGDTMALQDLARVRDGAGDAAGADEAARRAADLGKPDVLLAQARWRDHAGDRAGARDALLRAADAGAPDALPALARLLADDGDTTAAESHRRYGLTAGGRVEDAWW
jgi:hypothetical protein